MCQTRGFVAGFACAAVAGAVALSFGFAPQSGDEKKVTPRPPSKDKIPAPTVPGGAGELTMPPEMAAQMEFMNPGPEQAWLAERVGTWTATVKMWMGPGEPQVGAGVTVYSMILGGRFLAEEVKSTIGDQPFEARGLTGYNGATKKFETAWVDSMGTAISMGYGVRSADGKTLESKWEMYEPMTRKTITMRSVDTTIDKDHFKFEMFGPGADGKEMKMMEGMYTRSKR